MTADRRNWFLKLAACIILADTDSRPLEDDAAIFSLRGHSSLADIEFTVALSPFILGLLAPSPVSIDSFYISRFWQKRLLRFSKIVVSSGSARSSEAEQFVITNAQDREFLRVARYIQKLEQARRASCDDHLLRSLHPEARRLMLEFTDGVIHRGPDCPQLAKIFQSWTDPPDRITLAARGIIDCVRALDSQV